jgi:hypothetical protein
LERQSRRRCRRRGGCRPVWVAEEEEERVEEVEAEGGKHIVPITVITLLPLPSTERVRGLDIRHAFVSFSRLFYVCCVDLIVTFFCSQRRIRNEASNDRGVRQHPTTAADRISLRGLADDRNVDGHASLRSTTAAAACGWRVSVWQYSDSAATGWRVVVWKYPTACAVD